MIAELSRHWNRRLRSLLCCVAMLSFASVAAKGQQTEPLQELQQLRQQVQQLQQQYETTTRDLEQRLATLQQQIEQQKVATEQHIEKESEGRNKTNGRLDGRARCPGSAKDHFRRVHSGRVEIPRSSVFGTIL